MKELAFGGRCNQGTAENPPSKGHPFVGFTHATRRPLCDAEPFDRAAQGKAEPFNGEQRATIFSGNGARRRLLCQGPSKMIPRFRIG